MIAQGPARATKDSYLTSPQPCTNHLHYEENYRKRSAVPFVERRRVAAFPQRPCRNGWPRAAARAVSDGHRAATPDGEQTFGAEPTAPIAEHTAPNAEPLSPIRRLAPYGGADSPSTTQPDGDAPSRWQRQKTDLLQEPLAGRDEGAAVPGGD